MLAVFRRGDGSSLPGGGDFHADVPILAAGQSTTVSLTIVPDRPGVISVEALAVAAQADSNTGENLAVRSIEVVAAPVPPPPLIRDVIRLNRPGYRTRIVIRFRGALDANSATDLGNYSLILTGRDHRFGTADDVVVRLQAARYHAATRSVLLITRRRYYQPRRPMLTIGPPSGPGLRDATGRILPDTPYRVVLPPPGRRGAGR